MTPEEKKEEEWRKLMQLVFPPIEHPRTEAFVSRVMSRLNEETKQSNPLLTFSWRIPAFSLGAAAAVLLIIIQPRTSPVSTEMLLLEEDAEVSPQSDEFLELIGEE